MAEENTTGDLAHEIKPVLKGLDDEFYNPLIDKSSRANANMDLNHNKIHDGLHYYISEYITLGAGAVGDFVLEVGAHDVHFVFSVGSDIAGFIVQTYEDVDADEDGTPYAILNNCRPRALLNPCLDVLRYNPSNIVTAGKLRLRNTKIGEGGTPSTRTGGSLIRSDEVVLTKNIKYLLRITNLSSANNDINVSMSYYHGDIKVN